MPWEPLPTGRGSEPAPLGAALDRIAKGLGVPSADALTQLFAGWEDIVGPDVAAHTRPMAVKADTLVVAVDDPAWATQLRSLESLILEQVHARIGSEAIQRLAVRVRPD